jgi:mannose-6-phosphate isomerase
MEAAEGKILKLKGKIQHYAWGGRTFIPELLGLSNVKQQPFAEYWLGAHASAPAEVTNGSSKSLNEIIAARKEKALGSFVQKQFGRLPFLLKILDVKDMLSIQVHPAKDAAEEAYARENASGIPVNAATRNYRDDNHKPELLVAISEFWLLHGFKSKDQLLKTFESAPELGTLSRSFAGSNYEALYREVMEMPQDKVNRALQPLLDHIIPLYKENKLKKSTADFWAARAALNFNEPGKIDRGIFSIYLLNLVHLQKGEAVFQDAGILHAYLEGQNVEIMANSDNVLRGGLTAKHVDVKELMKHVRFEPVAPFIIHPQENLNGEQVYLTPAGDFELSCFQLEQGEQTEFVSETADILLLLEGSVKLMERDENGKIRNEKVVLLEKGESAVVFACHTHIHAMQSALLFRATTPVQNNQTIAL